MNHQRQNIKKVEVCIVTYKRPDYVLSCLKSLANLEASGIALRLVIIDNDPNASAKTAVQKFIRTTSIDTHYEHEPKKGLSFARNKALEIAAGDYIAFIDDDEAVSKHWLMNLLKVAIEYKCDAVFGPVLRRFPSEAPSWIHRQSIFTVPSLKTGEKMHVGATNNVLVDVRRVREMGLRFDPAFGETGGEDTEFFHRGFLAGMDYRWCAEAVVDEAVESHRLTLSWVAKRYFRNGQCLWRVFAKRYRLPKRIAYAGKQFLQMIAGALVTPLSRLFGYERYARTVCYTSQRLGALSAIFGGRFLYREYSAIRYRNTVKVESDL